MSRPRRSSPARPDIPPGAAPRMSPDTGSEAPARKPRKASSREAASVGRVAPADRAAEQSAARLPRPRRKPLAAYDDTCPWPADEFVFDSDPMRLDGFGHLVPVFYPGHALPDAASAGPTRPAALVPGQAAQEIARIRHGMQQIRQMIDGPRATDDNDNAWTILQRLCQDPLPHRRANATTAMARLMAFPPSAITPDAGVTGSDANRPAQVAGQSSGGRKAQGPERSRGTAQGCAPDDAQSRAKGIRKGPPPPAGAARTVPADTRPPTSAPIGPASGPMLGSGLPMAFLPVTDPFRVDPLMPATLVPQHSVVQPVLSWPATFGPLGLGIDLVPKPQVRPRVVRLLTAWADWLLWRLQPPRIPQMGYRDPLPDGPTPAPAAARSGPALKSGPALPQAGAPHPAPLAVPSDAEGSISGKDPMPATAQGALEDRATGAADEAAQDPATTDDTALLDQVVAQALVRALGEGSLRARLQDMIRDELAGEMGARFSGNLQAVIRREVASGLDDRLTHL